MTLHVLRRKLRTVATTIARVRNWPAVSLSRVGLGPPRAALRLRDGPTIEPLHPLRATWGEIFEPAVADLYEIRAARGPDVIVDIGANVGAFTCLAAHCHPQAVVHAFEPSAEHMAQLERNVSANGLKNVHFHPQAVTADGREVRFLVNGAGGSSGLFLPGDHEVVMPSVSLATLDFSPFRSAWFKLDCEGAEGEIVKWICAHRAALPSTVHVACEYHQWCPVSLPEMQRRLEESSFAVTTPTRFDEQYLFADSPASR